MIPVPLKRRVTGRADRRVFDMRSRPPQIRPPARLRIFDLYEITKTTVKIRGTSDDKLVCIVGVWTAITGGTYELDTAIDISAIAADAYIYVTVKRVIASASTAKLEGGSSLPNGDEDEEHYPLWFIPWDAGDSAIDAAEAIQYRSDTIHVTAFA